METKDSEHIRSSFLHYQTKNLNRSKDYVLICIFLNMIILILTLVEEIASFDDLLLSEIITISIIVFIFKIK